MTVVADIALNVAPAQAALGSLTQSFGAIAAQQGILSHSAAAWTTALEGAKGAAGGGLSVIGGIAKAIQVVSVGMFAKAAISQAKARKEQEGVNAAAAAMGGIQDAINQRVEKFQAIWDKTSKIIKRTKEEGIGGLKSEVGVLADEVGDKIALATSGVQKTLAAKLRLPEESLEKAGKIAVKTAEATVKTTTTLGQVGVNLVQATGMAVKEIGVTALPALGRGLAALPDGLLKASEVSKKVAPALVGGVTKAIQGSGKAVTALVSIFRTAAVAARGLVVAMAPLAPYIAAAAAAALLLKSMVDAVFARSEQIQRFRVFAIDPKQVQAIRSSLQDTLTFAEAAAVALQFRQAGIPPSMFKEVSTLANMIAKLSGVSEDAAIEMLRTGNLSTEAMQTLRVSAEEVEAAFEKARGGQLRNLTEGEKAKALIDFLSKRYSHLGKTVQDAFPTNPFKLFATEFRSIFQEIMRFLSTDFKPALLGIAKALTWVFRNVLSVMKASGKVIVWMGEKLKFWRKDGTAPATVAAKKLSEAVDKNSKDLAKNAAAAERSAKAMQRYRSDVQAAADVADIGLRNAASALDSAATAGSSVFSAQQALLAQITQLSAGYAVAATAGYKIDTAALKTLRDRGILSQREYRLALVVNAATAKEMSDRLVLLKTEQEALLTKRASLGVSQELAQAIAIESQRRTEDFKAAQSLALLERRRLILVADLEDRVNQMRKAGSAGRANELRLQTAVLQDQIRSHDQIVSLQKAAAIESLRQLDIQAKMARIAADAAGQERLLSIQRQGRDITVSLQQAQVDLLRVQGRLPAATEAALASMQKLEELDRKRLDTQLQIQRIQREIAAGGFRGDKLTEEQARLKVLADQNAALARQSEIFKEIASLQQRNLTIAGSFLQQLVTQAADAAQKIGQAAASATMGLVSALGGALSTLFEQLVVADKDLAKNFGKAVFGALGDMAMAFANTFVAIAAGKFALGDIAGGAGLAAAAVALYAVAGTLKGVGAAIGGGGAERPSPSASSSSPRTSLPGQEQGRQREVVRETYVIAPMDAWGDPLNQARQLQKFQRESERRTVGSRRKVQA